MRKIYLAIILSAFLLNLSCSSISNVINSTTDKTTKIKYPSSDIPTNVKNSKPDTHASEKTSIIVTITADNSNFSKSKVYIDEESFTYNLTDNPLKKLLEKTPAERQLVYLNANRFITTEIITEVIHLIRKENVENVGLVVEPQVKTNTAFNILKIKVLPEPKWDDEESLFKEWSKRIYLIMTKDNKLSFAKYDFKKGLESEKESVKPDELETKITERLAKTNDKGIYIKVSKSLDYAQTIKVIDAAIGAGAEVYLDIDDRLD